METILHIEGVGFPAFSARGCKQTLSLKNESDLFQRTINGELLFLGSSDSSKYISTITCQDKDIPALSHLSRGAIINVSCIQTLTQPLLTGADTILSRPCVSESILCFDEKGKIPHRIVKEGVIHITPPKKGYVRFRPILTMRILNFETKMSEWEAKVGWSLELEEV